MQPLDSMDADHFKIFGEYLKQYTKKISKRDSDEFLKQQKAQVENLVNLEDLFKKELIDSKYGKKVYENFIYYIRDVKRNILAARSFFRERQPVFSNKISKTLKKRDWVALSKFHFNFTFINFVMRQRKWSKSSPIYLLNQEIIKARWQLIEMNLPLAVGRARIFYSSTPRSQLSFMDMVQTSIEGLSIGIDKFCLPFSKAFRAVAIGRSIGLLIEAYTQPVLHFYPGDKRKIYKANKILKRDKEDVDYIELSQKINKDKDNIYKTNPSELMNLMAASSSVSSDGELKNENNDIIKTNVFPAAEDTRPDFRVEKNDTYSKLYQAIGSLSKIEKKILKLKGVERIDL